MNRDEAERAARAGAKVRRKSWHPEDWLAYDGDQLVDEVGNYVEWGAYGEFQWQTIPDPASTAHPDVEARLAALEEQFARHFHMTDPREDRTTPPHQPIEVGDWPDAERHLSAESLTGAMGDATLNVIAAEKIAKKAAGDTRASIIAEIEAWADAMGGAVDQTTVTLIMNKVRK